MNNTEKEFHEELVYTLSQLQPQTKVSQQTYDEQRRNSLDIEQFKTKFGNNPAYPCTQTGKRQFSAWLTSDELFHRIKHADETMIRNYRKMNDSLTWIQHKEIQISKKIQAINRGYYQKDKLPTK